MHPSSTLRRAGFVLALALLLLGTSSVATANVFTGIDDSSPIVQAEEAYNTGDYPVAIQLLEKHLRDDSATPTTQVAAYRLLGLAYVASGDLTKAQAATDNLVRIFPSYERTDGDTDEFATLVAESQQRFAEGKLARTKKKGAIPQFVYNTVALVTSAVVLYVGAKSM